MATTPTQLETQLDRLAAFEPSGFPVISLYLNLQSDDRGRDHFQPFVRKELQARVKQFQPKSTERESYEKDVEKIDLYLRDQVEASSNGVAIFACHGADLFEAVQLATPIDEHEIYITDQPHLYTLARIHNQFPRYAVVVADTNSARLFVFGARTKLDETQVENQKTRGTQAGGWSQARYQRHIGNFHILHVKEVVDTLARVVRQHGIQAILFAGDEVVVPIIRDQLPKELEENVVDFLKLDIQTPEHKVLETSLASIREWDAKNDRDKVERLRTLKESAGRGIFGAHDVLQALAIGQVEEIFLSANVNQIHVPEETPAALDTVPVAQPVGEAGTSDPKLLMVDALVTQARQTGAAVTFIEDPELLAEGGGIAATLRYTLDPKPDMQSGQPQPSGSQGGQR